MILILVGGSCSGKSSTQDTLVEHHNFNRLVTLTTRPKRENEIEGTDYLFVTEERFNALKSNNEVILPITYRGYQYGMPDTYFLPSQNTQEKFVTILLPVGIPEVKFQVRARHSDQKVIAVYIEPESPEFLAKCYFERTGRKFEEKIYYQENAEILEHRDLCDLIVVNREGKMTQLIEQILSHIEESSS